jgi:hypothetical protein
LKWVVRTLLKVWSIIRIPYDRLEAYIDRVDSEIEPSGSTFTSVGPWLRQIAQSTYSEFKQLPREILLIFASILTAFSLLDFLGYEAKSPPIDLILYNFGSIVDGVWTAAFSWSTFAPNERLRGFFTIQLLAYTVYIRGRLIRRRESGTSLEWQTISDQKRYLLYIWGAISFVYWAYIYGRIFLRELPNYSVIEGIYAAAIFVAFWLVVSSISMLLVYLLFYELFYKSGVMIRVRSYAENSPIRYLVFNLLVIGIMLGYSFMSGAIGAQTGAVYTTHQILNVLLMFIYLFIWAGTVLAAFSVPRAAIALGTVVGILWITDYGLNFVQ